MRDEGRAASASSSFAPRRSELVDTHCHLDWRTFDADRDEVVRRAVDAGVTRMVTIGVDVASSRRAIELADRYPAVYAAVGVHPNDSAGFDGETLATIRALARHPKVVAVGEIGLDYYRKKVAPAVQAHAFEAQLALASEIGTPVIIHNRDAAEEVLTTLAQHFARCSPPAALGVLHAYFDSLETAQRAFDLGFLIGFGGAVTFKKSAALLELARAAPPDRFVIETDAPFLTPEPHRGRRNEPAYVRRVVECLAQARGVFFEEVARQTAANAARLFGWTDNHVQSAY
jgi:TatD DNase family protein